MAVTVFVSGATGFIAQHIVQQLIERGYNVIGSVRSASKGDQLKESLKSDKFSYEIVADIQKEGAFDEALKKHPEVTVFLHTASPFHFNTTDIEKDLLLPAIEGTKNALSAIKAHAPQVKRVVVTSSYAAMFEDDNNPNYTANEASWTKLTWEQAKENPLNGYIASKTFAEQAAWDFVKEQKPHFQLSIVNPVYVFGPQAFDSDAVGTLNTSSEIINSLLKLGPKDEIPEMQGGYIDVRDVARAHLVAFESDAAIGQRILTTNKERFSTYAIVEIIRENFAQYKDQLPAVNTHSHEEAIGKGCKLDPSKSWKILGFEPIDLKKSVIDSVAQILKNKQ
ncbi:dihydroflavonol-4-reductase [Scheffersomyces xylosifermentans]|uniref:dihydroflavonol-4-reductase n=1 Tax=Scheffersomyces xylosifermentans TaxID=1304137 RepID=UPI00315CD0D6